jgi:stage II sporulation protein M
MKFNLKYIKINSILFALFFFIGFIGIYVYSFNIECDKSNTNQLIIEDVYYIDILKKNLIVCTIAVLGIFTFRVSSVLVVLANALVLGMVFGGNFATTGELIYFLKILIPHGVFELPAIILSCSIGLEGISFLKRSTIKEKISKFILIILLLVIVAFVEVNISTLLI